jgi:molybdopterin-guanine dinucleotide biosynthesis protein A
MCEIAGMILAGGNSSRMGQDKAFLEYKGEILMTRQIRILQEAGLSEIWISGRPFIDYQGFNVPLLIDEQSGKGPLSGIAMGLRTMKAAYLMVLAVDIPRMTRIYLQSLMQLALVQRRGIVPILQNHYETTSAIYSQESLITAEYFLKSGNYALQNFVGHEIKMSRMLAHPVSEEQKDLFFNWNSNPDLYKIA